eukprot:15747995-Heterocapsa_arctica.AAC.1
MQTWLGPECRNREGVTFHFSSPARNAATATLTRGIGTTDTVRPAKTPVDGEQWDKANSCPYLIEHRTPDPTRSIVLSPNEVVAGPEHGENRSVQKHRMREVADENFQLLA